MRLLLTVLLIYICFRIIVSLILPLLVRWYVKRSRDRFLRNNPQYAERQQKKEGEMTITIKRTSQGKPNSDKLGEYTDFEEVKEED